MSATDIKTSNTATTPQQYDPESTNSNNPSLATKRGKLPPQLYRILKTLPPKLRNFIKTLARGQARRRYHKHKPNRSHSQQSRPAPPPQTQSRALTMADPHLEAVIEAKATFLRSQIEQYERQLSVLRSGREDEMERGEKGEGAKKKRTYKQRERSKRWREKKKEWLRKAARFYRMAQNSGDPRVQELP